MWIHSGNKYNQIFTFYLCNDHEKRQQTLRNRIDFHMCYECIDKEIKQQTVRNRIDFHMFHRCIAVAFRQLMIYIISAYHGFDPYVVLKQIDLRGFLQYFVCLRHAQKPMPNNSTYKLLENHIKTKARVGCHIL